MVGVKHAIRRAGLSVVVVVMSQDSRTRGKSVEKVEWYDC